MKTSLLLLAMTALCLGTTTPPDIVASKVEREIIVSHWGEMVHIRDYVELENRSPAPKKEFSRLDYPVGPNQKTKDLDYFHFFLTLIDAPAVFFDYRDEIGMIYSFEVPITRGNVTVIGLSPRYPLLGGWRTSYTLSYKVPLHHVLHKKEPRYAIKMNVVERIYKGMIVENLTTKIVLPEHVTNVTVTAPYTMTRRPDRLESSYLDTYGRHVITIEKKNLTADHIKPFTISYVHQSHHFIREPIMTFCFYFSLFILGVIYSRFDFSIEK